MKEGLDLYEFFITKGYSWWDLITKATSALYGLTVMVMIEISTVYVF